MDILKIKDGNGNWVSIPAIKGDTGAMGDKGDPGDDYVITSADYSAIAAIVYNDYMTNATNVGY